MLETFSTIETQPYVPYKLTKIIRTQFTFVSCCLSQCICLKYKNIAHLKIINFDAAALKEDGLRLKFCLL